MQNLSFCAFKAPESLPLLARVCEIAALPLCNAYCIVELFYVVDFLLTK